MEPNSILIILIIGVTFSGGIAALRLTNVTIPTHIDLHESALMSCNFDLGGAKLYSIKWYKDEFEFFRYMPDNNPQIQTFPQPGINLDLSQSNMTVITLQPLNFNSTGSYRCEVSTDGPSFETVVRNGNMTVIVYPKEEPSIDGIQKSYEIGDFITGNCTSSLSNPPAELTWLINNKKVENYFLNEYPTVVTEGPLYSTALGLRFVLDQRHFLKRGQEEKLEITCKAKIADLPHWERIAVVRPARLKFSNHKPAPDRFRNKASDGSIRWETCILIVAFQTLYIHSVS